MGGKRGSRTKQRWIRAPTQGRRTTAVQDLRDIVEGQPQLGAQFGDEGFLLGGGTGMEGRADRSWSTRLRRPRFSLYLPSPLPTLRYASFDKLRTGRAGKGGEPAAGRSHAWASGSASTAGSFGESST